MGSPGELLPSQISSQLQEAIDAIDESYRDTGAPEGWNPYAEVVRLYLKEARTPGHNEASLRHLGRMVQEQSARLLEVNEAKISADLGLADGTVMKRSDFDALSPADQRAHIEAKKTVID